METEVFKQFATLEQAKTSDGEKNYSDERSKYIGKSGLLLVKNMEQGNIAFVKAVFMTLDGNGKIAKISTSRGQFIDGDTTVAVRTANSIYMFKKNYSLGREDEEKILEYCQDNFGILPEEKEKTEKEEKAGKPRAQENDKQEKPDAENTSGGKKTPDEHKAAKENGIEEQRLKDAEEMGGMFDGAASEKTFKAGRKEEKAKPEAARQENKNSGRKKKSFNKEKTRKEQEKPGFDKNKNKEGSGTGGAAGGGNGKQEEAGAFEPVESESFSPDEDMFGFEDEDVDFL